MPKILQMSPYCFPEEVSSTHMSRDLNSALFKAGFTIENFVPTPSRGISDEERTKYKKIKYEVKENPVYKDICIGSDDILYRRADYCDENLIFSH